MTLARDTASARRSGGSTASSGQAGRPRGVGSAEIKVKGHRATAKQRATIDGVLTEAQQEGASRRLMIAAIMCITQESGAGVLEEPSGAHKGPFQQDSAYGSVATRRDPRKAMAGFLREWKRVHGGIKKVPGNLAAAIEAVQRSGRGSLYAQWEPEATRTVDTILADGINGEVTYIKRYLFSRGERHGQRENSWDASARLVEEVGAYRWAAGNVFYAVSGDELRAGASSLTINGDEPWLLQPPSWSWANNRAITEVTLHVLADRWDVMPGGTVIMHDRFGVVAGRYMVWNVSGDRIDSPVVTIVLRRPTRLKDEPASEVGTRSVGGGGGALHSICSQISRNRHPYVYGGGHGPALSKLQPSSAFDCSSSCSYALYRAGMFNGNVAIVSGAFASSWGKHGKGDDFTVWANGEHVWIEGYEGGKPAWRFDTSHHGGKSGAMLSTVARTDQSRFTPKHWPGH